MATKKPSKNGKPKLRQKYLPGMKPPSNPKIDRAAETYEDAKSELSRAGNDMKDSELTLRSLMKEAKLDYYKTPSGINVIFSHNEKVQTKRDKKDAVKL